MSTSAIFAATLTTPVLEWSKDRFTISTDRSRIDLDVVHGFLTNSYWAKGISREIVERSIAASFCFGVYEGQQQCGFTRVITDFATYGYIADFFIIESHRRMGLAKWLIERVIHCEPLSGLRRWGLVTHDAHGLYRQMGFASPQRPELYMEIVKPEIYKASR